MTPDPALTEPAVLAQWVVDNAHFELDEYERGIINKVLATKYTGESTAVYYLFDLRILFWQVVGSLRCKK
jgi:hypothetical protein